MAEKTANFGAELMRMAEKSLLLQFLDQTWKDHLLQLDHLRQGINLRAYAQRDPLNEYKREAFELFEAMLVDLRQQVTSVLEPCRIARCSRSRPLRWPAASPRRRWPRSAPPARPARPLRRRRAARRARSGNGADRARARARPAPARPGPAPPATPPAPAAPARNSSTATAGCEDNSIGTANWPRSRGPRGRHGMDPGRRVVCRKAYYAAAQPSASAPALVRRSVRNGNAMRAYTLFAQSP